MKSVVSPQKTPIWVSICTPVAPILLISLGHSPRLGAQFSFGGGGGHKQSVEGARPRYAPRGADVPITASRLAKDGPLRIDSSRLRGFCIWTPAC